ncbi:MAG TPA: inositol monophosphatase family protein, partial [Thermoleophilia bacterium]|nr:inositol monophosphatase family protein [Thermoleophilia bacterium]
LQAFAPESYGVVSEEAGVIPGPKGSALVVIDPVDGSLNAKRGLPPYCAAFALARGGTLGDVELGYVADYSRTGVHAALRGAGFVSSRGTAQVASGMDRAAVHSASCEDARWDRQVEVVLLEAGRPHGHTFAYSDLARLAGAGAGPEMRIRQIGSLALCLCHLSAGTADVLFAPVPSRSVDIAGGLLMVAESGGGAVSLDGSNLLAQPLDLAKRAPFVAWRHGLDSERVVHAARTILI